MGFTYRGCNNIPPPTYNMIFSPPSLYPPLLHTAGVDYEIINSTIHFPSYLSVYGHLSAAQVAEFAVNPPVTTHCAGISIIDDNVLERTSTKIFSVQFSTESLEENRVIIESGVTITINDDDRE